MKLEVKISHKKVDYNKAVQLLEKRVNEEHKEIPEDVIARQVEAFEIPADDEGFDVLVIRK